MPGVQLAQVLAGPVVGGVVVHVDFFPDTPRQEGHGVAVPGHGGGNRHFAVFVLPVFLRHFLVRRPVVHLPEGQGVRAVVQLELLVEKALQRMDRDAIARSHHGIGAQKGLLLGVGVRIGEGVVLPDDADGGVNAVPRLHDLVRQLGAVAVADHVRAPLFRQLQRQLFIARFSGQGKVALVEVVFHGDHLAVVDGWEKLENKD